MNDIDKVMAKVRRKVALAEQQVKQKAEMLTLGKFAANLVKKRTRLGYGANGSSKERLKTLSDSYKQQRKGKIAFAKGKQGQTYSYKPKKKPDLSGSTTPGKSNLTRTGQLLDAIRWRARFNLAQIFLQDRRVGSKIGNNKLREYVEKDRPFFSLTNAEERQIARVIREKLSEKIRKLFS